MQIEPSSDTTGISAGFIAWRNTIVRPGRPLARAVRMKLPDSTSIMLPRITRAIPATLMMTSSTIGSTR